MREIGGYFNLELRGGKHFHPDALRFNTAGAALQALIQARSCHTLYLPSYICESLIRRVASIGVELKYYPINLSLLPADIPPLAYGEMMLVVNYFALKSDNIAALAGELGGRLIVDNSHAFFQPPLPGIDTIYSARKFFGVPDGAYLYTDAAINMEEFPADESYARMQHLFKRTDISAKMGYEDFRHNEELLATQPPKQMSRLTETLMCNIDYDEVARRRRDNYLYLHSVLSEKNDLDATLPDNTVPLSYPFLQTNPNKRRQLCERGIFIPCYWPNVASQYLPGSPEHKLATCLLSLPIDQRYNSDDMDIIISSL